MDAQYERIARAAAAYAHHAYFSSRQGRLESDPHLLVLYDNNAAVRESGDLRRNIDILKEQIQTMGLPLLSEASYPIGGEDDGYTVALVFLNKDRTTWETIRHCWESLLCR